MRALLKFACLTTGLVLCGSVLALDSSQGRFTVTEVTNRLNQPWSIGFLPDGSVLVTERGGKLLRITEDGRGRVRGVGDVWASGQGGLLDVLVSRDFEATRTLFFTFSMSKSWNKRYRWCCVLSTSRQSNDTSKCVWNLQYNHRPKALGTGIETKIQNQRSTSADDHRSFPWSSRSLHRPRWCDAATTPGRMPSVRQTRITK